MKQVTILTIIVLCLSCTGQRHNYLKVEDKKITDSNGVPLLLRGIGLGGWMLQEPYMLQLSRVAVAQYMIKEKITELVGEENCEKFYSAYLKNMITKRDIDSLKKWGFNSIRLPMHYNLFTLPVDKEEVPGTNTWIEAGFNLTDSLLSWCEKDKIYLILDLHAAPGGQGKDKPIADVDTTRPNLWQDELNRSKTVALWGKLAQRYSDDDWIGGYDLINETNWNMDGNTELKELYLEITAEIRKYDGNHIIFIEGNQFANDFTGLTPPWDNNMVYSFHKYWNPNTQESIQKYIDLRDQFNVPLWLGESGENNNQWYSDAVHLVEANDIGWAWWTIKKIGSGSGLMNVSRPDGYQEIINYWAGKGERPTAQEAMNILMQLAENMKLENCVINYGVIDALFGK
jgi:endoglucanase